LVTGWNDAPTARMTDYGDLVARYLRPSGSSP
jgi:hypothetical protein